MGKDVIIACDFPSAQECLDFLGQFHEEKPFVKIGMELFYSAGPSIVRNLKSRGHKIFLDLKMHDIPNTVASAVRVLRDLDVDLLNVHAAGSIAMMRAAAESCGSGGKKPLLIAVTQLTSTNEQTLHKELLIDRPLSEVVAHYAACAKHAGLNGVVCSPLESSPVHEQCGADFLTVTPGVRFPEDTAGDQKRITTPKHARELGSDYIVMGRPITRAADPVAVYHRAMNDFVGCNTSALEHKNISGKE
uniref:orotidine-5'-phosphate decarboxylase n=1 Tax=Ndongobacter massiliensis TaxID=1871025 RepID=UPI00092FF355|nr:orotidine-5'-phosphate decarboxylase [Ndongobacter massiliensis]